RRFISIVESLEEKLVGIGHTWIGLLLFSNAFLYFLVGVVIFVLPMFFTGHTEVIFKLVAIAIFCVGPVMAITSASPLFERANVGLGHVDALESRLDTNAVSRPPTVDALVQDSRGFREFSLSRLVFNYRSESGASLFKVG